MKLLVIEVIWTFSKCDISNWLNKLKFDLTNLHLVKEIDMELLIFMMKTLTLNGSRLLQNITMSKRLTLLQWGIITLKPHINITKRLDESWDTTFASTTTAIADSTKHGTLSITWESTLEKSHTCAVNVVKDLHKKEITTNIWHYTHQLKTRFKINWFVNKNLLWKYLWLSYKCLSF